MVFFVDEFMLILVYRLNLNHLTVLEGSLDENVIREVKSHKL